MGLSGNEEADILQKLEDESRERGEAIANSNFRRTQCVDCGEPALAVPEKVSEARCGTCLQRKAGSGGTAYSGPYTVPVGYPLGRDTRTAPAREEHPVPVVSSWDIIPAGLIVPGPVSDLRDHAERHGWFTLLQYARGNRIHGTTGKPTSLVSSWGLRIHLDTLHAVAVYVSNAAGTGWTWDAVWLFGSGLKPFGKANATDLKHWLEMRGNVPDHWFTEIVARVEGQEVRRKRTDACNRGKHADALDIHNGIVTCMFCDNSWNRGEQPWRKSKKAREHS